MKILTFLIMTTLLLSAQQLNAQPACETDTIPTSNGKLIIHFLGHGTLYFDYNGTIVHIDPVSAYADYNAMPKADIILVTHQHRDHFDKDAIDKITKQGTELIFTKTCAGMFEGKGKILNNGDKCVEKTIEIEAVPAYNIVHKRDNGQPYHPKGEGNGYVLTFGNVRVYIAGDTENIPEMARLKNIDIAFLPMNLPYTMTPEMVVKAVEMIKPKILYPYHFGNTDTNTLLNLMKNIPYCEVRIRRMS